VVASGNATSITWLKDNSILNISGDSRFINGDVSTSSLSISNVQQTDSGSYVCRAADATGPQVLVKVMMLLFFLYMEAK
jgi:hypothetical protein